MSDFEYLETEVNLRFFEVLREYSFDKRDPLHEWEFVPEKHTVRSEKCICTTPIQNNYYIRHKQTKKELIVGSECIKRWIQPQLLCKECSSPLGRVCERVRLKDFICGKCKRKEKARRAERMKKLGNYRLLFGKKYYQRLFKEVIDDIPYVEFLLNLKMNVIPSSLEAFYEYCSLVYEIKEILQEEVLKRKECMITEEE